MPRFRGELSRGPATMSPGQWQRVGELLHEALEVAPEARDAWAGKASTDDPEVRRELLSLLASDPIEALQVPDRMFALAYQLQPSLRHWRQT